jgi:hypothetical protein
MSIYIKGLVAPQRIETVESSPGRYHARGEYALRLQPLFPKEILLGMEQIPSSVAQPHELLFLSLLAHGAVPSLAKGSSS